MWNYLFMFDTFFLMFIFTFFIIISYLFHLSTKLLDNKNNCSHDWVLFTFLLMMLNILLVVFNYLLLFIMFIVSFVQYSQIWDYFFV
jgi:hypothetical protein